MQISSSFDMDNTATKKLAMIRHGESGPWYFARTKATVKMADSPLPRVDSHGREILGKPIFFTFESTQNSIHGYNVKSIAKILRDRGHEVTEGTVENRLKELIKNKRHNIYEEYDMLASLRGRDYADNAVLAEKAALEKERLELQMAEKDKIIDAQKNELVRTREEKERLERKTGRLESRVKKDG